jgi:hypothetical protein
VQQERDGAREQLKTVENMLDESTKKIWALQAELRALKQAAGSGAPKLLFSDDFTELPKEGPDAYAIDAPPGAFALVPGGGLRVSYATTSPRNHNGLAKAELGPRLGESMERYGRIPYGVERWHAVTITIPPEWKTDPNKCSVIDVHGTEDPGETGIGRNAPLSLIIWGENFIGWSLWSDKEVRRTSTA